MTHRKDQILPFEMQHEAYGMITVLQSRYMRKKGGAYYKRVFQVRQTANGESREYTFVQHARLDDGRPSFNTFRRLGGIGFKSALDGFRRINYKLTKDPAVDDQEEFRVRLGRVLIRHLPKQKSWLTDYIPEAVVPEVS